MTAAKSYRKKPVVIEAMHVDLVDVGPVVQWITQHGGRCRAGEHVEQVHGQNRYPFDGSLSIYINTLEGLMRADPGDMIIRGIKGEFYPCKPDVFQQSYEAVESP